jgi:C1A family cysteine protease
MPAFTPFELGWRPHLPDPRDYTPEHAAVAGAFRGLRPLRVLPKHVDWREYCPPIADARSASGTACAVVGLLRYFQRRASGKNRELSAPFVHYTARRLLCATAAGGDDFRATWKAVVRFGIPGLQDWPAVAGPDGQREPDAYVYAAARKFSGLAYVRLDGPELRGATVLTVVKSFLAAGFPCVCGVPVCTAVDVEADIPFPTIYDGIRGGQALLAVGFDEQRRIRSCRGALLVANSWGTGWGDKGYGWLPYAYVVERLAVNFWTAVSPVWLASGEFRRPV